MTQELVNVKVSLITEDEAKTARLHPRVLVEDYLYADVRNLIAAGGTGKTTLLLFESVMGALGRPIWGKEVPEPFNTVFVTKEDSREILVARMHRMLEELAANETERDEVWNRVAIVDLVGKPYRLSQAEDRALGANTMNLMALSAHLEDFKPDRVIFDPLISFTHGEGNLNDAEQAVVEAARYLIRLWPNAMIEVVHHTGKANGRAATTDQYSGRNGSALPDGCRMVAVLVRCDAARFYEATGIRLDSESGDIGLRLALPKLSYSAPQPDIYILRRGFLFEMVPALSPEEQAKISDEKRLEKQEEFGQDTRDSIIVTLQQCRDATNAVERYPGKSTVLGMPGVVGANKSRSAALKKLIEQGVVEELLLTPAELIHFSSRKELGGRKTYLQLADD
ncbi:MAG: AAA family ATPase [Limnohabitans sp.]